MSQSVVGGRNMDSGCGGDSLKRIKKARDFIEEQAAVLTWI